jgi:hypothetical protein
MHDVLQNEIDRMFRVSDLMITVHSTLRDRYAFRARATDIVLLVGGALVAAFTFLDPGAARILLPSGLPAAVLVGLAGIGIFVASLVQMKMDWNGRSALHGRAAEAYLSIKHELGRAKCSLVEDPRSVESAFASIRDRYEAIGISTISVPDRLFPRLKQIHRLKVEISKALDLRPGASILLLRWQFWWRDNIRGGRS